MIFSILREGASRRKTEGFLANWTSNAQATDLPKGLTMYRYMLGYDIRLCLEDYSEDMDEKRRNRILLRHDVKWPLSVDMNIWPSVFDTRSHFTSYKKSIRLVGDYFHYNVFHLWDDIERMKSRFMQCEDNAPRQGVVIASELHLKWPLESDVNWDTHWTALSSADPAMGPVPENWIFLGHDVAEVDMFYSGLCGYSHEQTEEWEQERKRWGPLLNEHGLFSNFEDALEYIPIADELDGNEAPFYAYALYRDPEVLRTD